MKHSVWSSSVFALIAGMAPAAFAQEQPEEESALEDIVVTAQFREQNLQETPIAITAITAETLAARGQNDISEIAAQAPNVTLTPGGSYAGPSLIASIRGVGQTDFNPALEPGVGLYVDDVYYSTLTGSILDLLDLDRVEILRGPQGTLSGKNSIGGAIRLFTQRPDEDTNGYLEVSMGDLDAVRIRGATNFTLIEDRLWGRISGVSSSRDGHVTTLDYGCTHPGSGFPSATIGTGCATGTEGGIDYTAARLALRWLAAPNLEVNLSGEFVDDNSEPAANTLLGVGPTIAPVIHPNGTIWETVAIPPTLGGTVGCSFIAYGPGSCDPLSPNNPYVSYGDYQDPRVGLTVPRTRTLEVSGVTLNVDWDITPDLQLQSISALREYESGFSSEYDASPMPIATIYQFNTHSQISQEFRLNGAIGEFADWTLGAFYFNSDSELVGRIGLGYVGFDFIHGPDPVETTNTALFANGIFSLTDRLELALGARYSEDEKDYTFRRSNPDGSTIQPCVAPPGDPSNPPNCLIASLDGANSLYQGERMDYRAALSYELTEDLMVYGSYATGYKGGGVNPRPFYDVQAVTFEPEEMETYELGVKAEFFDNRLRLNTAIFFNQYSAIQLTFNDCTALFGPTFGVPCLLNSNAGDAEVEGAEVEFDWSPTSNLLIDGSVSVIDFQFQNVNAATGIGLNSVTPYTPELRWSLGVQYDFDTSFGTITPRLDASYQDDVFTAPDNTELGRIEAYTLLNGSIRFTSPDQSWVFGIEGRNLTDELYYTSKFDQTPALAGVAYGSPALPRTFAVSIRRNF